MDPRLENELFKVGRGADVRVASKEDHALHVKTHGMLKELPWETQQQLTLHVEEHVQAMVQAEVAKLMQEQQQQQAAMGMPPGMPGGNGAGPVAAGGGPGGRMAPPVGPGRMAQTGGLDDLLRGLPRGEAM
jgi:hypothetical protein